MHQIEPAVDDQELLRAYAERGDEGAFAALVERHGRWMYAAALRQLHDAPTAEDAVQVVFILLAQRAHKMSVRHKVSGWLFNTLQFTVKNLKRAGRSRREHEERAARPAADQGAASAQEVREVAEVLDGAVARLPGAIREAILLRFYQGLEFAEVAGALSITEAAARKRVDRGLEALQQRLGPAAGAGLLLASGLGVEPISTATMQVMARTALAAKAGAVPAALGATVKGVSVLMATAKVQMAALVTAAVLAVTVPATVLVVQGRGSDLVNGGGGGSAAPVARAATTEAPTTMAVGDRAEFERVYRLEKGEILKRISPPIAAWRTPVLRQLMAESDARVAGAAQAVALRGGGAGRGDVGGGGGGGAGGGIGGPVSAVVMGGTGMRFVRNADPRAIIVGYEEGKPQIVCGETTMENGYTVRTLMEAVFFGRDVLQQIMGRPAKGLDGDSSILEAMLPGDFVLRNRATTEEIRAGLEKMLSKEFEHAISVKFTDVEEPLYVLRGTWNYRPMAGVAAGGDPKIHIYSLDGGRVVGNGSGDAAGLPSFISQVIGKDVRLEAKGLPQSAQFFMHDDGGANADPKTVLDHITEQTGLTWTEEKHKVRHVVVTLVNPGE